MYTLIHFCIIIHTYIHPGCVETVPLNDACVFDVYDPLLDDIVYDPLLQIMDVKPEDPKERPRASVSLDSALNEIGFGPYQVLAFLLAGLTSLACGTDIVVFSLIADSLHSEWGVDGVQFALLPSATGVSNILGGVVYGYVCDSYGRVWPYVLAMLNISIFSLASAFSPNFVTFLCLRLIVSFGITGGTLMLYAALVEGVASLQSWQSPGVSDACPSHWYLWCRWTGLVADSCLPQTRMEIYDHCLLNPVYVCSRI